MSERPLELSAHASAYSRFRWLFCAWAASRAITVLAWWASTHSRGARGFVSWDGAAYVSIAQHGYTNLTDTLFFPLFPWLSRSLTFGTLISAETAAIVAANVCALLAAWLIAKLCDECSIGGGTWAGVIWIVFPAAFVTVIPYPEGLTVCATCATLIFALRRNWPMVGVFALATTISRPTGFLIGVPLVLMAFQTDRRRIGAWMSLLGIPLGLFIYSRAVNGVGGLREILDQQRSVKRRGPVIDPLRAGWKALDIGMSDRRLGPIIHVVTLTLVVTVLWVGWKLIPRSLWWYSAAMALVVFSASNLDSTERYALAIVPLIVVVGTVLDRVGPKRMIFGASVIAQGMYAYATFRGHAVP